MWEIFTMNKNRRKALADIAARLSSLLDELDSVIQEEQDAYDNMPESLQDGDRGQEMQSGLDDLGSIRDDVSNAVDSLEAFQG